MPPLQYKPERAHIVISLGLTLINALFNTHTSVQATIFFVCVCVCLALEYADWDMGVQGHESVDHLNTGHLISCLCHTHQELILHGISGYGGMGYSGMSEWKREERHLLTFGYCS